MHRLTYLSCDFTILGLVVYHMIKADETLLRFVGSGVMFTTVNNFV